MSLLLLLLLVHLHLLSGNEDDLGQKEGEGEVHGVDPWQVAELGEEEVGQQDTEEGHDGHPAQHCRQVPFGLQPVFVPRAAVFVHTDT